MKLKKIVENMDKMPSTLRGFNDTPKLTAEQKSKLMDMVAHYNELGQKLKMEQSLIETATALSEISELAETYACNEAQDWFATEVVKKDFKRARNISGDFQKIAKECHGRIQQLNALYEDMGHILGRYYEIADPMNEVMPNPSDIKSQRGLPNVQPQAVEPTKGVGIMQEVKPNTSNLQSQRTLPSNGSIKEVAVDDKNKNIKSQRNLPAGGPAPAQVKEVAVDDMNKNIKGQRDLPAGGPSTPQIKETSLTTVRQTCKVPGCGRPVQRTLSAELCPIHASPKSVNVREVAVDSKNSNIKSQRDLPSGGPTPYTPPKDPKDTGSIKETAPAGWEKTVKSMKKHKEIDNPWALSNWMKNKGYKSHKEEGAVNEVKPNDSNIKSQRDLPAGGPTTYVPPKDPKDTGSVKETTKLPSMKEILGLKK